MTIDQFTEMINRVGTQLNNVDTAVITAMSPIVARIKAAAPRDTGALQQSIQMIAAAPNEFYLEMLAYGFFQNYGVQASPDSSTAYNLRQYPVEPEAKFGLPPSNGNKYQFGTRQTGKKPWGAFYSGINAQSFFTMGLIAQELTERMQQELNNNIQ